METILRYNNRKLYSKNISKYVNTNYLLDLIKTNVNFCILDYKSKKDVTNLVLAEAISKIKPEKNIIIKFIKENI